MRKINSAISKASNKAVDELISEYKALIEDAEALIEATEGHVDDAIKTVRSKALKTLAATKESIANFEGVVIDKAKSAAKDTDNFVHRNPWESVGVAAGLGLIVGLFIRGR
ncbi:DUF883 family protein [Polynucleobacter arcticus]|nr:DUF883 family protein [Polynucleobacter arcticus]